MKPNPVGWFEIYVDDLHRARAFYEAVLQTRLTALPGTEAEMLGFPMDRNKGGAAGALVKMAGVAAGGGGTLVYFMCDDCAVEKGRVDAAGGSVHQAKKSIGEYGFISLVVDTEQNMVGLHSTR